MSNKLLDYEDNMRTLVKGKDLKERKETCNQCKFKGDNDFCQKNLQWLPDYAKFRYATCPENKWSDGWSSF